MKYAFESFAKTNKATQINSKVEPSGVWNLAYENSTRKGLEKVK